MQVRPRHQGFGETVAREGKVANEISVVRTGSMRYRLGRPAYFGVIIIHRMAHIVVYYVP
jgi:hypothetical protein